MIPTDDKARKALPIFSGVLAYFPDALLAVAAVSKSGVRIEFRTAEEISQWLITEKLISTVPWNDVGAYLRFSVTFAAPTVPDEARIVGTIADRLSDVRFEF